MPARRGAGPSSPRAASPPGPPFARSPCPREPIQPGPSGVCLCPARVCHLFLGARPPRHWPFPSVTPGCALLHLRLLSWPVAQDEAPSLAPRIPRSPPPISQSRDRHVAASGRAPCALQGPLAPTRHRPTVVFLCICPVSRRTVPRLPHQPRVPRACRLERPLCHLVT